MKTASQILESKNVPFERIEDIVNNLDIAIREKYKVAEPLHLWEGYKVGDANEQTLLAETGYSDVEVLLNDMTADLATLAENFEAL
jgi:hypothetical protein